jgi:hypothetical protein
MTVGRGRLPTLCTGRPDADSAVRRSNSDQIPRLSSQMVATSPSSPAAPSLVNRSDESRILRRLLQEVQEGQSQSLVLSGDPGVGKTALLQFAVGIATGFRLVRATGVESEMELPFAGLHQFCTPLLNRLDSIPAPQNEALRTAFGLLAGKQPDRFLVGLGTLSLLSETAEEQPLLCVIDDAHWMDHASIQSLAFAARRLLAEHIGFLFVTRDRMDVLSGCARCMLERCTSRTRVRCWHR